MAPEVVNRQGHTHSADWWSYGVLMVSVSAPGSGLSFPMCHLTPPLSHDQAYPTLPTVLLLSWEDSWVSVQLKYPSPDLGFSGASQLLLESRVGKGAEAGMALAPDRL